MQGGVGCFNPFPFTVANYKRQWFLCKTFLFHFCLTCHQEAFGNGCSVLLPYTRSRLEEFWR